MKRTLVVAASRNGVIGHEGTLPWRLPEDLRRFRRATLGHPVVMGRRTFESIGRPLPKRRNLVLSRDPAFAPEGVDVVASLAQAFAAAAAGGADEVFVIGGEQVFAEALPRADRILFTLVHAEVAGDTFFPGVPTERFELVEQIEHPADAEHPLAMSFRTYERIREARTATGSPQRSGRDVAGAGHLEEGG